MNPGVRMAAASVGAGFLLIVALAFAVLTQSATTTLPYVLIGGCVGTGLVGFGTALYRVERRRGDALRVEQAVTRVLHAAAAAAGPARGRRLG